MMEEEETPNGENLPLTVRVPEVSSNDRSLRCGWLGYRPDFLQRVNNARWLLASLCCANIVLGMTPTGFVNVCLTTIEQRYQLSSTDTGMIAGSFDVAFVIMCLPISLLANRQGASMPRWLGGGMFLMALGSFIFALPHFLSPPYSTSGDWGDTGNTTDILCAETAKLYPTDNLFFAGWSLDYRYLFVLGQIFHGMGATPLLALGIAFLDASVNKEESPVFIGIYAAMAVGGAALGFAIGSALLNVYIDWPFIDPASQGLTPSSDLWLGCWWLCFLLSGCAATLVAIPLLAFPRKIEVLQKESFTTYTHGTPRNKIPLVGDSPHFERPQPDFWKVVQNKTFMSLALAEVCPSVLAAGLGAFMPKIVENQFSITASSAALTVGSAGVPAGCLGSFFGGWILKKLGVGCSGALKICIIGSTMLVASCFAFIIYCPNHDFAGVTVQYENTSTPYVLPDLSSACNEDCGCRNVSYNPVCGANNVVYFSPCHAGCTALGTYGRHEFFSNCSCIPLLTPHQLGMGSKGETQHPPLTKRHLPAPLLPQGVAITDKCPTPCSIFPAFLVFFIVIIFMAFALGISSISAGLRSIQDENRSIAFGVRAQITRTFGNVPGPILFGVLLDRTCLLWKETNGVKGSCAVYDHKRMNWTVMVISLVGRSVSSLFYTLAWWFHVPYDGNQTPRDHVPYDRNLTPTGDGSHPPSSSSKGTLGVATGSCSRSDTPSTGVILPSRSDTPQQE